MFRVEVYVEGGKDWGSGAEIGVLIKLIIHQAVRAVTPLIPLFLLTFQGPEIHSVVSPFLPSPFI
jgi:hypothetical protein